jgi:hypothetical protein
MTSHSKCHDSYARELGTSANAGALEAVKSTLVVQAQFKTIIALLFAIGSIVLAVFGWLVLRVDSQAERAREVASIAAQQAVQDADRKIDARMTIVAQDAAREAIRLRDAQIDRVTAIAH